MSELWHRCEMRHQSQTRVEFIRHRAALVGNTFRMEGRPWEIQVVHYPGLPRGVAREQMREAGLTGGP